MKTGENPAFEKALSAALHMLRGRDRFEAEIRQECSKAGIKEEHIDAAVEFLREKRMLNEMRLASASAGDLSYKRMLSKERIRVQLALRGAPGDAIDAALARLPDDSVVAERLWKSTKGETPKRLRKLYVNGFDDDVIARWAQGE